jgi:serine/threonine-protein kinase
MKTVMARNYRTILLSLAAAFAWAATGNIGDDLLHARDTQNLNVLDGLIAQYRQQAQADPKSAEAQYRLALANSYAAEVAMELRDKKKSESYAEAGMDAAKQAVAQKPSEAEYHRLLGELCGQVIPANPFFGALKYGQCAKDEIDKALQLNHKLAMAYVSRGVGNYYLPPAMGGGPDVAVKDFDQAIAIDPKLAEAYLWKGIALRKANKDAEARQNLERAVALDPNRVWAKQQLEKTPAPAR